MLIKPKWFWHKDKQLDQKNILENSEIYLHIYYQLIFDKVTKGKVFSINSAGRMGHVCRKNELWPLSPAIHKCWDDHKPKLKAKTIGISLAVQWLRLCPSTAEDAGSIPGQGTKIPHAIQCDHKKKKKAKTIKLLEENLGEYLCKLGWGKVFLERT